MTGAINGSIIHYLKRCFVRKDFYYVSMECSQTENELLTVTMCLSASGVTEVTG